MVDPSVGVRGVEDASHGQEVVTYLASLKSYKKLQRKWKISICERKGEDSATRGTMDLRKWNNLEKLKLQSL